MTKNWGQQKITCLMIVCFFISILLSGCSMVFTSKDMEGRPVEPLHTGGKTDREKVLEGRFSVVSPQVNFNNVSISSDGSTVLVSLKERAIVLDGEGKLIWENKFDQFQVSTAFSCCGNIMVSAGEAGRVSFFENKQFLWENVLDMPIDRLDISDDAGRIMVMSGSHGKAEGKVVLLDNQGDILWDIKVPGIFNAEIESRGQKCLVQAVQEGTHKIILYDEQGKLLWEKEGFQTAQLSDNGQYVAAAWEQSIFLFNIDGDILWIVEGGLPVTQISFSQNNRYILAYNRFGGGSENLMYLDIEGNLLWKQRIRDDSSVALSADGQRIVVASWRHYRDDLTLVSIFDVRGRLRREIDAGSRADKIALSDDGGFLALGCDDGNIYVLNLNRETVGEYVPDEAENVYYIPVDYLKPLDENETRVNLYFYDENALVFVPVTRDVKNSNNLLRAAIEELVKGPRVKSYLTRTIPKGIDIDIQTKGGEVVVNLPRELEQSAGATQSRGIIQSILYTLSQFPTVESIRFMVGGEERESFGDPGVYIGQEFSSAQVKKGSPLLYIPYRSGFRYYLVPWEIQPSTQDEHPAFFLSRKYFQEAASFIPCNVHIIDAQVNGDVITLDLNREFLSLFESPENSELKARAQVVIDGLVITLTDNMRQNKVEILVEGQNISPQGFANLAQPLEKPLNINPEQ